MRMRQFSCASGGVRYELGYCGIGMGLEGLSQSLGGIGNDGRGLEGEAGSTSAGYCCDCLLGFF